MAWVTNLDSFYDILGKQIYDILCICTLSLGSLNGPFPFETCTLRTWSRVVFTNAHGIFDMLDTTTAMILVKGMGYIFL